MRGFDETSETFKFEESRNAGIWELRPGNRQLSWRFRSSGAIPPSFFAGARWNYTMRKLAAACAVVIPKFQLSEIRYFRRLAISIRTSRGNCGPRQGPPVGADTAARPSGAPNRAGAVSGGISLFEGKRHLEEDGPRKGGIWDLRPRTRALTYGPIVIPARFRPNSLRGRAGTTKYSRKLPFSRS